MDNAGHSTDYPAVISYPLARSGKKALRSRSGERVDPDPDVVVTVLSTFDQSKASRLSDSPSFDKECAFGSENQTTQHAVGSW